MTATDEEFTRMMAHEVNDDLEMLTLSGKTSALEMILDLEASDAPREARFHDPKRWSPSSYQTGGGIRRIQTEVTGPEPVPEMYFMRDMWCPRWSYFSFFPAAALAVCGLVINALGKAEWFGATQSMAHEVYLAGGAVFALGVIPDMIRLARWAKTGTVRKNPT